MTVVITFSTIGTDAGPFNLYSNVDGYAAAFAVGISKVALLLGYPSNAVPDGTTIVRAKSAGVCTNFIDMTILPVITTTTTTTLTPTTTTTTTSVPTTTTTTSGGPTTTTTSTTIVPFTTTTTTTAGGPTTTTTSSTTITTTSTTTAPPPFNANLTFTNFTAACANPLNTYAYTSTDVEGTHFWSDPGMTVPINSGTQYFKFNDTAYKTTAPNGVVTGSFNCEASSEAYEFAVGSSNASGVSCCAFVVGSTFTLYTDTISPTPGMHTYYTDAGLTTPFNGNNLFWKNVSLGEADQITNIGFFSNRTIC